MNSFLCVYGFLLAGLFLPQAAAPGQSNSQPGTPAAPAVKPNSNERRTQRKSNVHPRVLRGKASWYGREFEGKTTASGTTFHAQENTAAAKGIPLGSTAKVTNLKNGRSVHVKVTDRGPEVPGRVLDVSKGTADQLGMTKKGVAPVKVTVVKPPPPKSQKPSSQPAGPGAAPQGKQGDPRE